MKKTLPAKMLILFAALLLLMMSVAGCGRNGDREEPVSSVPDAAPVAPVEPSAVPEAETEGELTDEQALSAIRNYCLSRNPDLKNIVSAGEYPAYWTVSSSDEGEIVVLFRSYTGALVRYYIDRSTGETYVTEFVPGITPEEERTEENFNVGDYASGGPD